VRRATKKNPIKLPTQDRSKLTFDSIATAATYILGHKDWDQFNTNHVADVAGVSVASVYQYFLNKEAILKFVITNLIERDCSLIVEYSSSLRSEHNGDFKKLVRFAIDIYRYQPKLRRKLNRFNLSMAGEDFITQVIESYVQCVCKVAPLVGHTKKQKLIKAQIVVHALMWSCNGFLEANEKFFDDKTIVSELEKLICSYIS
jgi:AcrR family transcriptional regulator